ncbi:MAG: hypothetical protein ACXQTW_01680 [Candidatus Methanospirareceae archaeon]
MLMQLKDILDEVIMKDVYKKVPVESELVYPPSFIPDEDLERMERDERIKEKYLKKLGEEFCRWGYRDLEVLDLHPSTHSLVVRYTGYYTGSREYPEVHLKTLLILHDAMGWDIRDPRTFDQIVEKARRDLGRKNIRVKEERLYHFAKLFKEAIDLKWGRKIIEE